MSNLTTDLGSDDAVDEQVEAPAANPVSTGRRRRVWAPDSDATVAHALRRLCVQPWVVAGRDDDLIATVRRHAVQMQEIFARVGWVLVVERDLVRLRKGPPVRRGWASGMSALTPVWFFLLVAAAESMPPRCALAQLVNAARAAAPEAGVVSTGKMPERQAIVAALKLLHVRGVVEHLDGDVDGYLADENAPVLLAVHHTRLLHVIANAGGADLASDPAGWLSRVEREGDVSRRMRQRLVDDTVVHACDLDEAEARWLSARVRDDGQTLADVFGLALERRLEGAAFVIPETVTHKPWERGDHPFPTFGTVAHAALKFLEHAQTPPEAGADTAAPDDACDTGRPGPGWRRLNGTQVQQWVHATCAAQVHGKGGWSAEYVENPDSLLRELRLLLTALGLLRTHHQPADPDHTADIAPGLVWWVSPAAGRWRLADTDSDESGPQAPARARLDATRARRGFEDDVLFPDVALFTNEEPDL